jgi:hypothetical protein
MIVLAISSQAKGLHHSSRGHRPRKSEPRTIAPSQGATAIYSPAKILSSFASLPFCHPVQIAAVLRAACDSVAEIRVHRCSSVVKNSKLRNEPNFICKPFPFNEKRSRNTLFYDKPNSYPYPLTMPNHHVADVAAFPTSCMFSSARSKLVQPNRSRVRLPFLRIQLLINNVPLDFQPEQIFESNTF